MSTTAIRRTRPAVAAAMGLGVGLVVAIVVLAFLWPVATSEPHDLPVGVVGGKLPRGTDVSVDATSYETRADAVRAIEEREVYGAYVMSPDALEVLIAGAGQAAASAIVEGLGTQLSVTQGVTPTVTDVVPLSSGDPAGSGLSAMGFPLVLGGIVGGVLVSLLVAGVTRRLLALGAYAFAAGLLAAVVTGPILGITDGSFWTDALVLGVAMLGTASTVAGLNALLGTAGTGVGAAITMLIANPISGGAMPYQFITGPWGEIGQYFVPGAAQTLFRKVNYFPDASTLHEWLVLFTWIVGGVALSLVGHFRSSTPVHLPDNELEEAPEGAHLA